MDELENDAPGEPSRRNQGRPETIDDIFRDSRLKIEMIIELLAEKLSKGIEVAIEEGEDLTKHLDHLERLIFLSSMNRAKTKDLAHLAPKKYQKLLSDAEIKKSLRPLRNEDAFPKRGPKGPREDAAQEPAAEPEDPSES